MTVSASSMSTAVEYTSKERIFNAEAPALNGLCPRPKFQNSVSAMVGKARPSRFSKGYILAAQRMSDLVQASFILREKAHLKQPILFNSTAHS